MSDIVIPPLRFTPPTQVGTSSARPVGRPQTSGELLVVSGNPRALENRPANAMGRIPIPAESLNSRAEPVEASSPFDIEAMKREVENSEEYQALKLAGLIKENPLDKGSTSKIATPEKTEISSVQIEVRFQRVSIEIRQEQRIEARTESRPPQTEAPPRRSDPLALDLDGNGLETSGVDNGVHFDIDADGRLDRTSFISGGDAFLALDTNGNGRIDDGSELFGDQNGDANGYLALARYDDSGDALIDQNDTVFQQLRLFTMNSDGSQQLRSLDEGSVASISLSYNNSSTALNEYDSIIQQSKFTRVDGSEGESGDLLLGYRTLV